MKVVGRARLRSARNVSSVSAKKTCVLPSTIEAHSTQARSNTCASGRYDRMRFSGRSPMRDLMSAVMPSLARVMFSKQCITPLGCPVEPEV